MLLLTFSIDLDRFWKLIKKLIFLPKNPSGLWVFLGGRGEGVKVIWFKMADWTPYMVETYFKP